MVLEGIKLYTFLKKNISLQSHQGGAKFYCYVDRRETSPEMEADCYFSGTKILLSCRPIERHLTK